MKYKPINKLFINPFASTRGESKISLFVSFLLLFLLLFSTLHPVPLSTLPINIEYVFSKADLISSIGYYFYNDYCGISQIIISAIILLFPILSLLYLDTK
jgi:hypothetical protein